MSRSPLAALSAAPFSETVLPQVLCRLRAGGWSVVATVENLSAHGLFVPCPAVLPEGVRVEVHLRTQTGRTIAAEGVLAWSGRGPLQAAAAPGLAVRFTAVGSGLDELRGHAQQRQRLLKTRDVPVERLVPLIFLPVSRLAGYTSRIRDYVPSPLLQAVIHGYDQVGMKHRRRFLWQATRIGMEAEMLPGVLPALAGEVNDLKTLGAMVDVLFDDLADEVRDRDRLERLILLLSHQLTGIGGRPPPTGDPYADFAIALWEELWRRLEHLPRYEELRQVLRFDWQQVLTSMRFSLLVSEMPHLLNLPEHDAYLPHNMHMMCNATIDLMASPGFLPAELPVIRRAARIAQRMGRIGNVLTTWERELRAGDLSSGVFPYLVERQLLSAASLRHLSSEEIAGHVRAAHVERYFLLDWENLRGHLLTLPACRSVDLPRFAQGLDELLLLQLASEGLV